MPGMLSLFASGSISPPLSPSKRHRRSRFLLLGGLLGIVLSLSLEGLRMLVGSNAHIVLPGRIYRSAQLDSGDLAEMIRSKHIRTVINLRGFCPSLPWYQDEFRTTSASGVSQEDVTLSANRLPSPGEIRRLVDVLDHTEYPVLIHCRQGADRTGLASAVAMLLYTDADYAVARRQCSPRYGHWPILATASMDDFFSMYEHRLEVEKIPHSPARFRRWIVNEYIPDNKRAILEAIPKELKFSTTQAPYFKVRARNASNEPWHFKPGSFTGIHLDCVTLDPAGNSVNRLRFGQRECRVQPGESIDIEAAMPILRQPGRYTLYIDLAERQMFFFQYGSELLTLELVVTEEPLP